MNPEVSPNASRDNRGRLFGRKLVPRFTEGPEGPQISSARDMNALVDAANCLLSIGIEEGEKLDVIVTDANIKIKIPPPPNISPVTSSKTTVTGNTPLTAAVYTNSHIYGARGGILFEFDLSGNQTGRFLRFAPPFNGESYLAVDGGGKIWASYWSDFSGSERQTTAGFYQIDPALMVTVAFIPFRPAFSQANTSYDLTGMVNFFPSAGAWPPTSGPHEDPDFATVYNVGAAVGDAFFKASNGTGTSDGYPLLGTFSPAPVAYDFYLQNLASNDAGEMFYALNHQASPEDTLLTLGTQPTGRGNVIVHVNAGDRLSLFLPARTYFLSDYTGVDRFELVSPNWQIRAGAFANATLSFNTPLYWRLEFGTAIYIGPTDPTNPAGVYNFSSGPGGLPGTITVSGPNTIPGTGNFECVFGCTGTQTTTDIVSYLGNAFGIGPRRIGFGSNGHLFFSMLDANIGANPPFSSVYNSSSFGNMIEINVSTQAIVHSLTGGVGSDVSGMPGVNCFWLDAAANDIWIGNDMGLSQCTGGTIGGFFECFTSNTPWFNIAIYGVDYVPGNGLFYMVTATNMICTCPKSTPTTGHVARFTISSRPSMAPRNIRFVPWRGSIGTLFVPTMQDNAVLELDPATNTVTNTFTGFDCPWDILDTGSSIWAIQSGLTGLKKVL